jgi:hypothetical protein
MSLYSGKNLPQRSTQREEPMKDEQVFRFVALRQSAKREDHDAASSRAIDYSVTGATPPLAEQIFALPVEQRTREVVRRLAIAFQQSERYVKSLAALPLDLAPLTRWADENGRKSLKELDVPAFIELVYKESIRDLVKGKPFRESADNLAETLFSDAFGDGNASRRRDHVVYAIKLLHLLDEAAEDSELLASAEPLGEFLGRTVVVLPELTRPQVEPGDGPVEPPLPPPKEPEDVREMRAKLARFMAAHDELTTVLSRTDAVEAILREPPKVQARRGKAKAAAATGGTTSPEAPTVGTGLGETSPQIMLSRQIAGILSNETGAVFGELKIDPKTVNPFAAVTTLETQMMAIAAALPNPAGPRRLVAFGGGLLDAQIFSNSYGSASGSIDATELPDVQSCDFRAGIGDLLIVRQKLKAYELGDFAHIENVLVGESREREHRRLNLREEINVSESERETEKERNLQSTERNEMQNEANKTVQSQFQLESGLQISGSYGPSVDFAASLNVSQSSSAEETQRKAVSYSREVTEKTSERIREKVRQERRVRTLEQIEEINAHRLQNTTDPKGHIRGIYRWLNKIYDAQVFNYGQRMMYEFVVPEPAAYYLYAMIENPPNDLDIEKPEPPKYGSQPLKPENLTRTNYQQYLSQYNITGAKAPPSSFVNLAYFDKQEGRETSHYERAAKLTIPDGYEAISAVANYFYAYPDDEDPLFGLLIGSHSAGRGWVQFNNTYRSEISVAIYSLYVKAFAVTVDVVCRLTPEGNAKWQHETYATILEGYLNQKAAYEEKLAAVQIQRGPQILGRNPFENRRIEREELKKLVLMMLMKSPYLDINSYFGGAEPFMNVTAACRNGSLIRFFENAFEWPNMTYLFYSYFWNRHARWITALHLTDPDTDFAGFLRAGAARIQLPVRPGFEKAVAYYSQTGEIWEGNDVPILGDDLYVPIVQEIAENLGKLDEGVPYPPDSEPWEVTVPTSLVLVQDLDEIPVIRDILTGNPIKLLPPANA